MAGTVCHDHFVAHRERPWEEVDKETESCAACKEAKQQAADRIQREHTIRQDVDYGRHIRIVCRACGAEGTTKNIRPLGCRTLFVACDHGPADMEVLTHA